VGGQSVGELGQQPGLGEVRHRADPRRPPLADDTNMQGGEPYLRSADGHRVPRLNAPFELASRYREPNCGGQHQGVGGDDREDLVVGADGEV